MGALAMGARLGVQTCACGLLLALALTAGGSETWRGKPPAAWTQDEALEVLNDSPWARTVELYQPSGRRLGVYSTGQKVVVQDSPNSPLLIVDPPPRFIEQEFLRAIYAVRWSSAATVQEALARLKQHSTAVADTQAPSEELSPDHFVLTARVVEPPTESDIDRLGRASVRLVESPPGGRNDPSARTIQQPSPSVPDLFAGLSEEELREAASLRLEKDLTLKPERAVRHGLGTSEGVTFYFPRVSQGRPTIPPRADSVEFRFRAKNGITLKAKFKLAEMQAGGKPDY